MRVRQKVARNKLPMFGVDIGIGRPFIRYVSLDEGDELVQAKKAARVHCPMTGRCKYYQLLHPEQRKGVFEVLPPNYSVVAITAKDIEKIVGARGKSQTEGMNDRQRAERRRWGLSSEDSIERARAKAKAYLSTH